MKKNWLHNNLFLICSIFSYCMAVLTFFLGSYHMITWLCLGSLYLCIHVVRVNKRNKEKLDRDSRFPDKRVRCKIPSPKRNTSAGPE